MTDATSGDIATSDSDTKKRSLLPIILGVVGALILGGGGFYAVYSGLVFGPKSAKPPVASIDMDFAYVPVENLTITLAGTSPPRHLRFSGQIEVPTSSQSEMMRLQPRFLDVINTYFRAIDPQDLLEPAALIRLRAQILRRLKIVAGDAHIQDFLITEFILN